MVAAPQDPPLALRLVTELGGGELELPAAPPSVAGLLAVDPASEGAARALVEAATRDEATAEAALAHARAATERPGASLFDATLAAGVATLRGPLLACALRRAWEEEDLALARVAADFGRRLAAPAGLDADEAYLVGLLHDAGRPAARAAVRALGAPLADEELDATAEALRAPAGAALLAAWGAPASCAAAARDADADDPRAAPDARRWADLARVAGALARAAVTGHDALPPVAVAPADRLGLSQAALRAVWEERDAARTRARGLAPRRAA